MSDIAGPPAPKDIQPSVRSTDKASYVAKDPANEDTRARDNRREDHAGDKDQTRNTRDPAVSIAATAAHLTSGQEIIETVAKIDAEGRPVVVTDTVTLALKPDAGLKPNDEIHIKVVDSEKLVTADLLKHNGNAIDPPIRLNVTVIEIHGAGTAIKNDGANVPLPPDTPYQAPKSPPLAVTTQTIPAGNTLDDVAMLVGTQKVQSEHSATAEVKDSSVETQTTIAGAAPRASSVDLATLIQQQASKPATTVSPAPTHSGLVTVPFTAAEGPGVGPAITGVSLAGEPAIIQALNPAISQVSPALIATVNSVQTLSANEARALPVGASLMANSGANAGELARVETNRGDFVLPALASAELTGEIVRVVVDANPANNPVSSPSPKPAAYNALLTINSADTARVIISPEKQAATAQPGTDEPEVASITSVQTVAAFLSPDGPKTDVRLATTAGTIAVTVPSNVKFEAGQSIAIVAAPEIKASSTAIPSIVPTHETIVPSSEAADPQMQQATTATVLTGSAAAIPAHTQNILAHWPAMEEAAAALAASNIPNTGGLLAKTAQGGGKLTNSLLFFLAAAGRAGPNAWLGANMEQALTQTSQAALSNVRSDLQQMATLSGEIIGEWRPIILPFDARGGDVPLAALLIGQRHDIDPDANRDDTENPEQEVSGRQRFILQVQFSILGNIQLDGSIGGNLFDLIVRSTSEFSGQLKQDAEQLFYASLAANEYGGSIKFLEQQSFPVDAATLIEDHLLGR